MFDNYGVIVVGAGHAGCEAAAAAANMGSKVLLITMDMTKIAQMSCNPAMGGIAKGQIVKEIDALGGLSGIVTDKSSIQFRMLNLSKGPAMWSPRSQCDRAVFSAEWRKQLEENRNVDFYQDLVTELVVEDKKAKGVITKTGVKILGETIILTNGTFLNGLMHVGLVQEKGGRDAETHAYNISEQLQKHGIESGRMKTGTPARLDGRSIDFSELEEQMGDEESKLNQFSYLKVEGKRLKQRSCFITHTNRNVHKQLEKGFESSPMFSGKIKSIGPRYCPSIEDKIVTFSDKESHHLFLEPEGESTVEWYLNGFSSSLSRDVQLNALRKVKGLENVKIFRPGYAIEYDYFMPTQLNHTLESKVIENLFFAGQINGTTGYEEAGAQGLVAGINADRKINGKEEFILKRDEAYIGVLIDDLVTKGVDEPYRMFTSRAEYRILLRQDNADIRLTEIGYKLGIVKEERYCLYKRKKEEIELIVKFCMNTSVKPNEINETLTIKKTERIGQSVKLNRIILRPQIEIVDIYNNIKEFRLVIDKCESDKEELLQAVEVVLKYQGYIKREKGVADKLKRLERIKLNPDFNYNELKSISTEARQKLTKVKPKTIGQASRIPGISPSDINVILVSIGR